MHKSSQSPSLSTGIPDRVLQPHSCVLCQRRKVKCDRRDPCSNCVKHQVQCVFRAPAPPRRRRKHSPDKSLEARLKRAEDLLEGYGVKPQDLEPTQDSHDAQRPLESAASLQGGLSERNAKDYQSPASSREGPATSKPKKIQSQSLSKSSWAAMSEEFKHLEELLEGSDADEEKSGPGVIQKAFDKHHADGAGLLFGFSVSGDLKRLHPNTINIFKLWQTYLTSIHPLSMIFHAPTVQQQILDASSDLQNVSESTEALMFAIYYAGSVALSSEDCETMFGEPQTTVMNKYMLATQQALNAAKMLKNLDITVLQAFVILLLVARQQMDPRSLWVHSGTAVRLAQRIGLHRDGAPLGIPPFEAEMRRRLWWQICLIDSRVSELSGAGTSVLSNVFDTKLPLNVNDSDLNPDMTELPIEHTTASEMTFCLARYQIADFLRTANAAHFFLDGQWSRKDKPPATAREKDEEIDEIERRLQQEYLRYCDQKIAFHYLTFIYVSSAILRMRLVAHHPRHYSDKGASMSQSEKDFLCSLSLRLIENDNLLHRNKSIDRFQWFVNTNFQFPAFVYLMSELRHRTRGELADRGWAAVSEAVHYRSQFMMDRMRQKSPMFHATSTLSLKAWQARENDFLKHGERVPEAPEYIVTLRSIFGNGYPAKGHHPSNKHRKGDNGAAIPTPADSSKSGEPGDTNLSPPNTENQWAGINSMGEAMGEPLSTPGAGDLGANEWSPMDWTYWDELIQGWEPQLPDSNGAAFDFGEGIGFLQQPAPQGFQQQQQQQPGGGQGYQ